MTNNQDQNAENQNHSDQKLSVSEAAQKGGRPGNQNAQTHGIYTFIERGPDALTEEKRSRFIELKEQFENEPGRIEYRKELAASAALIVELGMGDIRDQISKGRSVWTSAPTARIGTFMSLLTRLLDSWPKDRGMDKNILDLLKGNDDESKT